MSFRGKKKKKRPASEPSSKKLHGFRTSSLCRSFRSSPTLRPECLVTSDPKHQLQWNCWSLGDPPLSVPWSWTPAFSSMKPLLRVPSKPHSPARSSPETSLLRADPVVHDGLSRTGRRQGPARFERWVEQNSNTNVSKYSLRTVRSTDLFHWNGKGSSKKSTHTHWSSGAGFHPHLFRPQSNLQQSKLIKGLLGQRPSPPTFRV